MGVVIRLLAEGAGREERDLQHKLTASNWSNTEAEVVVQVGAPPEHILLVLGSSRVLIFTLCLGWHYPERQP